MKNSNYLVGLAALALVGCSDNDFLGTTTGPEGIQQGNGEITFTSSSKKLTRAGDPLQGKYAAEKLNNIFVVWGEKNENQNDNQLGTGAKAADGDLTFMNYLVRYIDGTAGNTESNSRGWEYVGETPYASVTPTAINQTIKYWDYAASAYTFYGFSAKPGDLESGNVVAEKTEEASSANKNYDKGYVLTLNGLASLDDLYFAKRKVIMNADRAGGTSVYGESSTASVDDNKIGGVVNLEFQAAAAKIRFGIYETIPGYSVSIDKVYYSKTALINNSAVATGGSSDNFGINGDFIVPGDGTKLTVTYAPYGGTTIGTTTLEQNTPIVSISDAAKSGYFETVDANSPWMNDELGITSNTASFNLSDKEYKAILPNLTNSTDLVLTLDYTLTSTDGSGEKIKVYGAQAHVPASFSQWQSNFAYTYLFKITDNTNGHTGSAGSTDPAGLYPITFDAVVLNSELGNQETITTIANPSITTYQNGSKVVDNNEYTVLSANGDIYITVDGGSNTLANLAGKYNLYTAVDLGRDKEGITEAVLANYANNDVILTDVTSTISSATGTTISGVNLNAPLTAGQVVKFTPTAGNTYVFKYKVNESLYAFKVIKVEGSAAAHTYTIEATASTIVEGGTQTITIKEGTNVVTGAQKYISTGTPNLTAVETTPGTYTITAAPGLEGAVYNVSLSGGVGTSNTLALTATSYAFANGVAIPEDVTASDAKKVTIQSKEGTASYSALTSASAANMKIVKNDGTDYTDVVVDNISDGVVTLKVKDGSTLAKDCKIQYVVDDKVLAEADITVAKYAFDKSKYYVNKSTTDVVTTADVTVTNSAISPDSREVVSSDALKASASTVASNKSTITPVAKGTTTISLGSASADVEVTQFTVKFYSNFECTTGESATLAEGYVRFFDNNGNPAYATLKAAGCTLERISTTGAYKISGVGATAKITYTYNGTEFTLAEKTSSPAKRK